MEGLNTEPGIDFGFHSSRLCKFKGIYISREHGENLFTTYLIANPFEGY
jgi:hypothetical protein